MAAYEQTSSEAEHIGSVLGFEGTVVKTGYLMKRAKKSGANWKRRYFVLNGSSLVYYETHKKMEDAKGDLLLTVDCVVRDVVEPKYPFCFEIASAFETLRIAAGDPREAHEWKSAINQTVSTMGSTTRGFLNLQIKGVFGKSWTRKFFVLHANAITYHQDHYNTYKKLGELKLTTLTTVTRVSDLELELATNEKELLLQMKTREEMATWYDAITDAIGKLVSRDDLASKRGSENDEQIIVSGYLATQPDNKVIPASWPQLFYALTSSALYQAEGECSPEALNVFLLEPSCSVYPTKLHANAFELVTSRTVLHLYAKSKVETQRWITSLRKVISESSGLNSDPLLAAARRISMNEYSVTFATKQKLNIILERAAEWAIVKSVKENTSVISEGSALVRVNGVSTVLQPYDDTIRMLTGWQPPLTLTFARTPKKCGWLAKQARGRHGNAKNWKKRYFVLDAGKLSYFENEKVDDPSKLKDTIQLMGCAVSLVSREEIGHNFCFRLGFGVGELVMQATTLDGMVEWASTLYHAIALANGGGYLLGEARKRNHMMELDRESRALRLAEDSVARKAQEAAMMRLRAEAKLRSHMITAEAAVQLDAEADERATFAYQETGCAETKASAAVPYQKAGYVEAERSVAAFAYRKASSAETEAHYGAPIQRAGHTEAEGLSEVARQKSVEEERARAAAEADAARYRESVKALEAAKRTEEQAKQTGLPEVELRRESSDTRRDIPTCVESPCLCGNNRPSGDETTVYDDEEGHARSISETEQDMLSTPLTDTELGNAYSVVSDRDYINAMQFVTLLRAVGVSDRGDLKFELDLFHAFDTNGSGVITQDDFVTGFQNYFMTHGFDSPHVKEIFLGIRAYKKSGHVEL
ncbi:hypothetical protein CTAYLR_002271 [Chrysophaeum taylorii]|uniref:PH domain-containing protein n=1 Tax=Chrysophaeum taylorii TaxID=2483200 RepID=A0AAD7XN38_9STRA|nr:hypothetical protein CTAYLR_002271 [Chrysophaeum taylorii]